jgi:hypothetical protein
MNIYSFDLTTKRSPEKFTSWSVVKSFPFQIARFYEALMAGNSCPDCLGWEGKFKASEKELKYVKNLANKGMNCV